MTEQIKIPTDPKILGYLEKTQEEKPLPTPKQSRLDIKEETVPTISLGSLKKWKNLTLAVAVGLAGTLAEAQSAQSAQGERILEDASKPSTTLKYSSESERGLNYRTNKTNLYRPPLKPQKFNSSEIQVTPTGSLVHTPDTNPHEEALKKATKGVEIVTTPKTSSRIKLNTNYEKSNNKFNLNNPLGTPINQSGLGTPRNNRFPSNVHIGEGQNISPSQISADSTSEVNIGGYQETK